MYIVDTRQSYIVCTVLSNPRLIILYCYRPNRVLKTNLRVYRRVPISIYLDKCKLFVVKFQKRIRKNDQTAHVCCLTYTPMSFNKICTTWFSNDVYIIFFLTRRLRSASSVTPSVINQMLHSGPRPPTSLGPCWALIFFSSWTYKIYFQIPNQVFY